MSDQQQEPRKPESKEKKTKRPLWTKVLRILLFTILGILVMVIAVITVAVSYLKPERLTPLVEKYANEYLRADVTIGRMELSFWSTFPRLELDVRDLDIRSKAFDGLKADERDCLPAYADSLLSLRHFNAAINIPKLTVGSFAFYDIIFENPRINIVQLSPDCSNLDIFPPSEESEKSSGPLMIPDISIGTFEIRDTMPVRYFSASDSTDVAVCLTTAGLNGEKAPVYKLDIQGNTDVKLPAVVFRDLAFGIGGDISWSRHNPYRIALSDFVLRAGEVRGELSADVDFGDTLRVDAFEFKLPPTPYADFLALVPPAYSGELSKLESDLSLSLGLRLTAPYAPALDSIPSLHLTLDIPDCRASYERLRLKSFILSAEAEIDGRDLDRSTVDLKRLSAIGDGVGFELIAKFATLLSDPSADGTFRGGIDIDRLPSALLKKLPCTVSGNLRADSRFSLRKSYLSKEKFHLIRLTGDATLRDFRASMPELPADLYTRTVELKLGTNSSFTRGDVAVDSMLTVSLKIDTISADVTGMALVGSGLKMGVGSRNTASSADTTLINPLGARIVADRLFFKSQEDSLRVRLRKATVGATLRRYKGDAKKPQLHLDVATESALYGDRVNRAMLRKALLYVTVYPDSLPATRRRSALMDSLSRIHPELSQDSLRVLAASIRKTRRGNIMKADSASVADGEVLDITVDNSMRRLLRTWDAKGILRAERMAVFSPYFPLRNSMSDLNMRFTSDSLTITDTRLRSGNSELTVNGSISNITKALTSRAHSQPLKLDFTLEGDTLDVNQLAAAVFAGAAFAERDSSATYTAPDTENEAEMAASVQVGADSTALLVIPSNVEGTLNVRAANILYSNMTFHDFRGKLNVYNGAINLEQMTARTDVGSIDFNALYSAPTKQDATFAFGLKVSDFRIAQFLKLVPSLDSLMPLLSGISGIINADIAATTGLDAVMNLDIPTLKAAVKLSGDSLVLIDEQTFRKIGKWLLFKHKEKNVIDSMNVEMIVNNSQLELFPFIFNLDRYKLGVMGSNDMAMNLNYHIAVLKSPLPFKFGINIKGDVDNMKIRLGRAKFNEKNLPRTVAIADTTRVNLVREIGNIFRRGVRTSKLSSLDLANAATMQAIDSDLAADTISHADSLYFIKEGLIPAPDTVPAAVIKPAEKKKKRK